MWRSWQIYMKNPCPSISSLPLLQSASNFTYCLTVWNILIFLTYCGRGYGTFVIFVPVFDSGYWAFVIFEPFLIMDDKVSTDFVLIGYLFAVYFSVPFICFVLVPSRWRSMYIFMSLYKYAWIPHLSTLQDITSYNYWNK